ncbi:MAG: hypothetical protein SRB2_00415 [Desulfobacteraceae bacterium Eth-SRB2]|nr:MAG: hypothetical protein SRB2_00415 [Desulfobacteraceae bacterium Eth-SRB2]
MKRAFPLARTNNTGSKIGTWFVHATNKIEGFGKVSHNITVLPAELRQ